MESGQGPRASTGLMQVGRCCVFTWSEGEYGKGPRVVEVRPDHCVECITVLKSATPSVTLDVRGSAQPVLPAGLASAWVMVVDDDEPIRDALVDTLLHLGYGVTTAADGQEALAYLRSGAPPPGLILLDVRMPAMDGHQFRAELQMDPALADIQVVMMTAVSNDLRRLQKTKVLRKPLTLQMLGEALQRYVPPARMGADGSRAVALRAHIFGDDRSRERSRATRCGVEAAGGMVFVRDPDQALAVGLPVCRPCVQVFEGVQGS